MEMLANKHHILNPRAVQGHRKHNNKLQNIQKIDTHYQMLTLMTTTLKMDIKMPQKLV